MKKLILISIICFLASPAFADENVCGPGQDGYLVWINCPSDTNYSTPDWVVPEDFIREIVRDEIEKQEGDLTAYGSDGQLVEALTRKRVSGDEIVEYDKNRMIKHIRKIRQELEKIEIIIRRGD